MVGGPEQACMSGHADCPAEQANALGVDDDFSSAQPRTMPRSGTPGDTPLDRGGNDGSSPYEEPNDGRHEGRER